MTSSYNADNELISSSNGWTYSYDANGNRVAVTAGGNTTHYTYDYATDLAPVSTTRTPATTSTTGKCNYAGCSTNVTIPRLLLPTPQTDSVAISGSVYETDQIDSYPNCPTRTVTWYYVFNGAATQLGSQTLSLNHVRGCYATFSGSWSVPLTLHTNDTIYEGINFLNDTTDPATYGVSVSVTVSVSPYLAIQYGPDGLRSSETVNRGSTTTHYGYDLLGMGGLPEEVADFNGTAVTMTYFYGVGSDRPLDLIQGGVPYLYRRDVASSTTTLTDASGNVAASYRYDAYGNLLPGSGDTIGNPLRYTGLASDGTSGLTYARARWYDPATGAYLTPDPLGGGYAYAGDNPVNFVDPSGMTRISPRGGGGSLDTTYASDLCDSWAVRLGKCVSTSAGSGAVKTEGGVAGNNDASQFSWDRCKAPIALFVIGLVLAFAGLYVGDIIGDVQLAAYITGGSWDADLAGIVTGPNVFSDLSLIWDIGSFLIFDVILPFIPWYKQVLVVGEEAAEWTPPGLGLHATLAAVTFGLGLAGLAGENCVPTNLRELSGL